MQKKPKAAESFCQSILQLEVGKSKALANLVMGLASPFRLVSVRLLDAQTNEPIFKRRMWLGVWGKRAAELTLEELYWAYRQRFDIEHFLRFGKQALLMDSFQAPDIEHLDNWMEIVSLAYWLLWVAKEEAEYNVLKWQKYDKRQKAR